MQRILIIRFSSIGDIVLTSPVVRVLRNKYPNADIRFVTKAAYAELAESNPNLNGVFLLSDGLKELAKQLKEFNPDLVVDLHHNLRTRILRAQIGGKWLAFNKLNVEKWLKVNLKLDKLPDEHVVDRYLATIKPLGIENDGQGLDFFFPSNFQEPQLADGFEGNYVALVIGAKFATKQLPTEKLIAICDQLKKPVVLIGGPEDTVLAKQIKATTIGNVWYTCGKLSLLKSAWLVKKSAVVITHDTGMMHIAAAFDKKTVSVWGNTIPQFGMYSYIPRSLEKYTIEEVENLSCRPCSKIGYAKCPKGHFKCMMEQDVEAIVEKTMRFFEG